MGNTATVARNAVWLSAQAVLTGVAAIVVAAIVARYLGTESYGSLLLMLSYYALFAPITYLGLRPYSVREIAANRQRALEMVEDMLALRLALALLAIATATAYLLLFDSQVPNTLVVAMGALLMINTIGTCFIDGLYGVESFKSVATAMAASGLVLQLASIAAVLLDAGLVGVASAYVLGAATLLGMAANTFRRQVGSFRFRRLRKSHLHHVQKSWIFFLQNLVLTIRSRIDLVLIGSLLGAHAAGIYGSAQTLIQRMDLLHDGLNTALFPRVADLHEKSPEELKSLVRGAFKILLVLSTPMGVGLFGVAEDVVRLLFGVQYLESIIVLQILSIGIPFSFTYGTMFNVLMAMRRQRAVFIGAVVATVVSICVVVASIKLAGVAGAAGAFVFGLACLALPLVILYWRQMGPMLSARDALGILAANATMGVVLWLITDLPLAAKIPIAAAVYAAAIRLLGVVTLEMLRGALRRPKPVE